MWFEMVGMLSFIVAMPNNIRKSLIALKEGYVWLKNKYNPVTTSAVAATDTDGHPEDMSVQDELQYGCQTSSGKMKPKETWV